MLERLLFWSGVGFLQVRRELVLMTAIGAGALAGGTALVLAGRRKAAATA